MTSAPVAGRLTLPAIDAVAVRRGADRVVVVRRPSVPLVQVRALLPGPGGPVARLAAAALLRRTGVLERLDGVSATAQASSRPDGLLLTACAEPGGAHALVAFLLELLGSDVAPPDDVLAAEAARLVSADEVAARDPGELTRRAALAGAFGTTSPYAEPLTNSLHAVTSGDVQRWHAQTDPAVVVVCGDVDVGADWGDPHDAAGRASRIEPSVSRPGRWSVQDRPGSAQTTLRGVCGFPAPGAPDRAAAEVVQRLLGGDLKRSRLARELRERRGFGYHPGTSVVDLAQASYLLLEVDVATEVTGEAIQVVDDVLASMSEIPSEEGELGRRGVVGDLARAMDGQGSLADLLLAYAVAGVGPAAVAALAQDVAQTTAAALAEAGTHLVSGLHGTAAADVSALGHHQLPSSWHSGA